MTRTKAEKLNDKQFEKSDTAIRRHLDLRPSVWSESVQHPDQRPCPSWCWVGQTNGAYQHEVNSRNPAVATHSMEGTPHVMASCYGGWVTSGGVHTATIEPHLIQNGQNGPVIRIGLRQGSRPGAAHAFDYETKLSVTIADARELIDALRYLVEIAEAG